MILIINLLVIMAACSVPQDDERPVIVATTAILADVVSRVVGDAASVEALIPSGVNVHDYSPSPQDAVALEAADVVVAFGLGLESGFSALLEKPEADARLFELGPLIDPVERSGTYDPHVWLDPVRMAAGVRLLGQRLGAALELDLSPSTAAYAAELEAVHDRLTGMLGAVPAANKVLVSDHDALGYFADRYGVGIVGVLVPSSDSRAEPSPSHLRELVAVIELSGVRAVIVDSTGSSRLAESVIASAGVDMRIVPMDLGSLGEGETYVEWMVRQAQILVEAMTR